MNNRSAPSGLTDKKCIPCNKSTPALKPDQIKPLREQLEDDWQVVENHHLEKEYSFENFRDALAFTNRVGELAEEENHHPEIALSWGKVGLKIWTHNIGGLSENDFILAAKADEIR